MSFKSGFVSIIGAPNVGKSTLVNTIVGEKVAIVSPKPQTTRNKILGIYNKPACQIVFIDTPGIHSSKNKLDDYMQKSISNAISGVDVVVVVIDGSKFIGKNIFEFVKAYDKKNINAILVVSKTDETNFDQLYPKLDMFNQLEHIKHIIPLSSHKNKNVDLLVEKIIEMLPEGEKFFDDDVYTDNSIRFLASEIIREKMLWLLQDEIPHGIAVEIINFNEKKKIAEISADIICEKKGHKQIIIGKDGQMIKNIGTKARIDIEKMLNKKVVLNLFVKVRVDWRNNEGQVKNLGYKF